MPSRGAEFHYGEPLRIGIEFTAMRTQLGVAVGIGIDDVGGTRIATLTSNQAGFTIDPVAGASYRVELTIADPRLKPGTFGVSCAIVSGEQILDFVSPAATFEIAPIDAGSGAPVPTGPGIGPVTMDGVWSEVPVTSVEPAEASV
jgi:hypothetical protein